MILRYLLYLSVADKVSTAISNVSNIGHIATENGSNTGCAHSAAQHIFRCTLVNQGIRAFDRVEQGVSNIITIILIVHVTNGIYSYFACHFTSCMSAHTISHNEQSALLCHHLWIFRDDISHIIFIVFTLPTYICQLCNFETELFSSQRTFLP